MEEIEGFFEEIEEGDCEEVELSAKEEEYESIEEFKESPISAEIDGVLKEAGYENVVDSDPVSDDEEYTQSGQGSSGVKVIYVNKSDVQVREESVSDNQVVLLDSSQFEILVNELRELREEETVVQTVSMNDYSGQLDRVEQGVNSLVVLLIVLAGLCFGYFVKESIFRGN